MNECINGKTKTKNNGSNSSCPTHTQIHYHTHTNTQSISQILSRAYCLIFIHKHVATVFLEGKEVENNRYLFAFKSPKAKRKFTRNVRHFLEIAAIFQFRNEGSSTLISCLGCLSVSRDDICH